jgi:hypothetical protein
MAVITGALANDPAVFEDTLIAGRSYGFVVNCYDDLDNSIPTNLTADYELITVTMNGYVLTPGEGLTIAGNVIAVLFTPAMTMVPLYGPTPSRAFALNLHSTDGVNVFTPLIGTFTFEAPPV